MDSTLLTRLTWILVMILRVTYCQPQNQQQYGPPQNQYKSPTSSYGSHQPESPATSSQSYGPPGHNPGQPLGYSDSQSSCPPTDLEANKSLVKRFYQEAIGNRDPGNLESFLSQDYINHNPHVPDGLEGFRKAISSGLLGTGSPLKIDFQRVSAEENLVWTHTRSLSHGKVFSTVDIFRVECGRIQEHWDVMQDTTLTLPAANSHPFF